MEKEGMMYNKLGLYKWLSLVAGALTIALITTCNTDVKKNDTKPIKKEPIILKKKLIKESMDTINFSQCRSVEDMIVLLKKNNYISCISPKEYFDNHQRFFNKSNITQEQFESAYKKSDIVKYGVYTDAYTHVYHDKYLEILNNILVIESNHTEYIHNPTHIVTEGLHGVLRNIYPTIDDIIPQKQYPQYDDIEQSVYKEEEKYPWWIAKDTLDKYNVFLKSSQLGFKEIGNNYSGNRTCIHGFKKKTLECIKDLAIDIQKRFGSEICKEYKIITVSGGTEKDSHINNPYHDEDHPGGSKFDLTVTRKRGILLGMYLADYDIITFQSGDELNYTKKDILGYSLKIIPHAAHFDISVE